MKNTPDLRHSYTRYERIIYCTVRWCWVWPKRILHTAQSQLKLSPAAVFKLYGDGWPQPSRWRALYHRQIFFTGFGNIFPRIVWGHIYQAVTSHNTHLFCLKCEDCVSWSSWLGDLHSYTCVEIRSSPPPPESYNQGDSWELLMPDGFRAWILLI